MFQFHFGSIGRSTAWPLQWLPWCVSIPLWFDWKNESIIQSKISFNVSIPLWFDWKTSHCHQQNTLFLFQFHFGSIGSSVRKLTPESGSMFQFHFGSIGSLPVFLLLLLLLVSIPLWFDWKLCECNREYCFCCFNSTLVRLEEQLNKVICYWEIVSIPLWFDWKTADTRHQSFHLLFQFHFGSIGREPTLRVYLR